AAQVPAICLQPCDKLGLLPPPRAPGLPGSRLFLRKSGKPDVRWGRAAEGGRCYRPRRVSQRPPPPLTPPHTGEGRRRGLWRCRAPFLPEYAPRQPSRTALASPPCCGTPVTFWARTR